ncbi:MAG: hypothetical protein Q9213_002846 [Squamulea squamosa]
MAPLGSPSKIMNIPLGDPSPQEPKAADEKAMNMIPKHGLEAKKATIQKGREWEMRVLDDEMRVRQKEIEGRKRGIAEKYQKRCDELEEEVRTAKEAWLTALDACIQQDKQEEDVMKEKKGHRG